MEASGQRPRWALDLVSRLFQPPFERNDAHERVSDELGRPFRPIIKP